MQVQARQIALRYQNFEITQALDNLDDLELPKRLPNHSILTAWRISKEALEKKKTSITQTEYCLLEKKFV